ncbi:hypothetical protein CC1G_05707 [Coprinopsis cinerea okayama7|uniref:Uncharacterized protein n=1 Tax=Coprinopsis cinerea (strain Okayama-7 / 130 / ATCC MYA-4618 / FGSC 9003) TaxID=240176 RepID=A8N9Y0_COPC7|nr:hypothetical protein CC1G_05707 [Coprinopsis cinerea okayama7\|eukprot:XP_001831636.1 hypothetical protein CC1G_05707 [Coprinopsis cinerea okayama7\
MSSSSSESSSSRTPSPSGSHMRTGQLSNFDPFATHPFTSFAGPSQPTTAHGSRTHILPHPSMLNLDGHSVPPPIHHPVATYANGRQASKYSQTDGDGYHHGAGPVSPSTSSSSSYPQSNMTPSQTFKSIHVPFRQDTSSPDLSEVLRRKKMGC